MSFRTIIFWSGVIICVLLVYKHPDSVGHLFHSVGGIFSQGASSLSQIINSA
jgi:hypothetical protein